MYRTHTCGCLRIGDVNKNVTLCGWVQRIRNMGGMTFVDLRDRYGITQLIFNMETNSDLCLKARNLGREYVIQVKGKVIERSNKNPNLPTGDIEIEVEDFVILNPSVLPPFTIEDNTDGGEEIRMKYRYLDLRRECLKKNIILRHEIAQEVRNYLSKEGFLEIETPYLIRSTPEGARDFIVPSRMNPGEFYALPQSPQTFKQLLMIAGFDKYFQLVRCFRDEDLRADRQPEFTQIDCEMSFVDEEDILFTFEKFIIHLFKKIKNINITNIPRITYNEAMSKFGCDKPDIRFGLEITDITEIVKNKGFRIFDESEVIICISVPQSSEYTRKQLDELTEFVKKPQIGATGLIYIKYSNENAIKSSVDKYLTIDVLKEIIKESKSNEGDLILILAGNRDRTYKAMSELRIEMGNRLGFRKHDTYAPVWIIDFPLFEWDETEQRYYAKHHPFTSPKDEDLGYLESEPSKIRAKAYDLVINGVEIGGGSIRIHNKELQKKIFKVIGFSEEEAYRQFGFLMNAFEYGAPPHGGIAFGFDRLCSLFGEADSIRDFIAFPKNNAGRDVMIDAPSPVDHKQLDELKIKINF